MQNVYKRINAIGDKATDNLQGPTKITPKKAQNLRKPLTTTCN